MESIMAPVLANLLKTFRPIAAPARTANDPKQQRRNTFLAAVREQIALLEDPARTKTIRVKGEERQIKIKPWWYTADGDTVLAPRFGTRPIELAPGATALKVAKAELRKALEGLAAAASAGELDVILEPKQRRTPTKAGNP